MLRVLDLFSGIGGFSLGLERTGGFQTVAFCEIEPFCQRVLAKHWPGVPIYDDVRTADFPAADFITAGFPCQDLSLNGNRSERTGLAGARTGHWREVVRALRVVRPIGALLENVAALLDRGMGEVLGDLASSGYSAEWDCVPAAAVGAPTLRDRVFIVAHADSDANGAQRDSFAQARIKTPRRRDAYGLDLAQSGAWSAVPEPVRVDYGVPGTLDRLAALGNAVVPQIPELIGKAILEAEQR
jgi:DNA (cytosine-5)-methyltransferase 1